MRMIPSRPYNTPSNAERRVFDWLKQYNNKKIPLTAFHSVTITDHARKRFGEIDFLISSPLGLFVLEIKGGGVSRDKDGNWVYTNKHRKKSVPSREGPFRQAEGALHALVENLNNNFQESVVKEIVIGYGVITPDSELPDSSEWNSTIHAGKKTIRNFERWLDGLIKYWRLKHEKSFSHTPTLLDQRVITDINHYLRPNFDVMSLLYTNAQTAHAEIASLTDDQMRFTDAIEDNSRVLCPGSAGTGKTLLAQEIAKCWAGDLGKVLFVCYSKWLKCYLETRIDLPNVLVTTIEALPVTARRYGVDRFDALIVDEGQDIMQLGSLEILDQWLIGGLENGRWCFFYDLNNQANLFSPIEEDAFDLLNSYAPMKVPLKRNCRNTKNILECIQSDLGADMGVAGAGEGPDVTSIVAKSDEDAVEELSKIIDELIGAGGMAWGDITILSTKTFSESSAFLLDKRYKRHLIELDEHSMRNFPLDKISYAEISNFKGLENECVLMVDMNTPEINGDNFHLAEHYVAMSRAKVFLRIIYTSKA